MTNNSKLEIIKNRLNAHFHPSYLEVIDDSDKHIGHAGHQGGGRHFTIRIAANQFANETRVNCHRKIYALFDDMIPDEIHALSIVIVN